MQQYWVIYDEIQGQYDDETHEIKAIGCDTKMEAERLILQHPEAIIIHGLRMRIAIVATSEKQSKGE